MRTLYGAHTFDGIQSYYTENNELWHANIILSNIFSMFIFLYTCVVGFYQHFGSLTNFPRTHICFNVQHSYLICLFHCYLRWIRWKTRKWIAFKWKNKHCTWFLCAFLQKLAQNKIQTSFWSKSKARKKANELGEKHGFVNIRRKKVSLVSVRQSGLSINSHK